MMDGKQLRIVEREQSKLGGWVWSPTREGGESL